MRQMSVAEQRYQAVLAVSGEGRTIAEVAAQWRVDRRTVHRWLARYEVEGLEGLSHRSHKPVSCPHQMPARVEALVLELRRTHRYWGARRLVLELLPPVECPGDWTVDQHLAKGRYEYDAARPQATRAHRASMTLTSRTRLAAPAVLAAVALAACGSSHVTGGVPTSSPPTAASPTPVPLPAALTAADIVNSGVFTLRSDSLLGGLANTDARVFATNGSAIIVEVDLVADTGATAAVSDYPPYQSAAAKQAGTQPGTSSPGLGQQSDEYVGVNTKGKNAVSISFIEGLYIVVVTTVGDSTVTRDVVKTSAESIAVAQDNKINSIGS